MNYLAILTTICALCTAHVSQAQNKPRSLSPEQLVFGTFESSSTPGRAPASSDTGVDVCFPKSEKCLLYNAGVTIMSRELDMPGGKIGAHSWIQVMEGLNTFTVGGHNKAGKLEVLIWQGKAPPGEGDSKDRVAGFQRISVAVLNPPPGMTQREWNAKVKEAAKLVHSAAKGLRYEMSGGDGGKTSGNCHVIVSKVLEKATSPEYMKGLKGYDPVGLNPGWTYTIELNRKDSDSVRIKGFKL